jgi:hypothetical protein
MEQEARNPQLNILAVIRRFSNWFNRNFICSTIFSKGHVPEPYLTETECVIHTRRCKRCKATLGLGKWKHIPPPPNSTPEQIKIFEKYREEQLNEIRRSVQTCV